MESNIKHLSQSICQETAGIIWLTDSFIDFQTPGVYQFNYLFDGMILKNLGNESKQSNSNFYLGENFGRTIFLGHSVIENKKDISLINDHLSMALSMVKESKKIFIYNKSKNTANINILKDLSSKYTSYSFQNLLI